MGRLVVIFCLLLLSRSALLHPIDVLVRVKRQDVSQMQPWMELGMKYGCSASQDVLMPMAMEAMELAADQFGPGSS